ncbi:MAG TPA: hypothetical protein VG405_06820 [Solirubrobacteraceae bacterium]|nr:hypothetical protein [Solirubrobacteraceae bacterium]
MSAGSQRFEFRFAEAYARAARPFGITPSNAWVQVGEDHVEARYGRWRVVTGLSNVTAVEITGPYRFVKTAGPPRLGITDLGLTFASNGDRGVLLSFRNKVSGLGPLRHPELTVTVADPETLAEAVRSRLES